LSDKQAAVSLRTVAERVGLAVCSVSAILNNTPASMAIPQRTKDRVLRAAGELNYRPNLWARSLRTKRTRLVAAITSDIGRAPVARVLAGVQRLLHRGGYLLALGTFDRTSEWQNISVALQQRGIEGVVAIDATLPPDLAVPVASVHLDYLALLEPLTQNTQAWLSELGESAAETVLRQIEKSSIPRRMKVVPRLPGNYLGVSSADLRVAVMPRESA
jgi:DNA-binding LacI/PurR family transcriptional regulator